MRLERTDAAFNRVMNGNFSHGTAYWGGANLLHIRKASFVTASTFSWPWKRVSPGVDKEGGPTYPEVPMYNLVADGWFWHEIQYNDLSVYPSIINLEDNLAYPVAPGEFIVVNQGVPTGIYPFAFKPLADILETVTFGDLLVINAEDDRYSGEYRAGEVYGITSMRIHAVSDIPEPAIDSADHDAALYRTMPGNPSLIQVRILGDLTEVTRSDGLTGFKIGIDSFVSKAPQAAGSILGMSYDGTYTTLVVSPPAGFNQFPNTSGAWVAILEWYVIERFKCSVTRSLPVCLYDLTLAYSIRLGHSLDPDNVKLKFYDEFGNLKKSVLPSGPATVTQIPGSVSLPSYETLFRVVQKFRFEMLEPWFGKVQIGFDQGGITHISDVVLYKGDYSSPVTDSEETGFLEGNISVESEIVPKGTIIAYVGGRTCPPGYVRAEGLGGQLSQLGPGVSLLSFFGKSSDWFNDVELITLPNGEVRTRISLKPGFERVTGTDSDPWQVTGGWSSVVPFRYDTGHPDYSELIEARNRWGDPDPVYVDNLRYKKSDVVPGCIIELRFPPPRGSVFAIISQFAQGQSLKAVRELEPQDPLNLSLFVRVIAINFWDRNEAFQRAEFFGEFVPDIEDANYLELVGDFSWPVREAFTSDIDAYVWKSGVISHAQSLEDMKSIPIYPEKGFGGYGLVTGPHSHKFSKSDVNVIPDVGNPVTSQKILVSHTHGWMFGAVALPRVRPVLLCTKM